MGFHPVGEKSRKNLAIDLIAPMEPDQVITFEEIAVACDLRWPEDRDMLRSTIHQARPTLANDHHKALAAVRGVGYRVIRPEEHIQVAAALQRKAGRSVALARTTIETVDLAKLDDEQRQIAMAAGAVLAYQQEQLRRLDLRQRGMERLLGSVTEQVDEAVRTTNQHQQRLADLEKRLAALEG